MSGSGWVLSPLPEQDGNPVRIGVVECVFLNVQGFQPSLHFFYTGMKRGFIMFPEPLGSGVRRKSA